ncbi:hypothetical protein SELMODRAFT_405930 [Selaginella moellendorffii]|uniref:ATPase domain-containing protein n=1 Tax=Selaginella moellendorffii TaxID=88036 RepID=D8R046_SELML|nr:hypothetical protein SELMODRAFT_405930 [Selaginella moellendorffii]
MVIVTGPKDSGKTALLREYRRRQAHGEFLGVSSYIDMREKPNVDPAGFAASLRGSMVDSMELKEKLGIEVLGANVEHCKGSASEDGLSMTMRWLESYCLERRHLVRPEQCSTTLVDAYKQGFPTIFIDEANALAAWHSLPDGEAQLEALFRFLVRISKQECGAHIVLASSESFFRRWLLSSAAFQGHGVSVFSVGHLAEEEAKAFMLERVPASSKKEAEAVWDDVFAHVGGAILNLHRVVRLAHRAVATGERLRDRWEREKKRLFMDAAYRVMEGFRPEGMRKVGVREPPKWKKDDWARLVKKMADSRDGVIAYDSLADVPGLDSMIEHDLLQLRAYSDTEREIIADEWPVVIPTSRMALHVMRIKG